METLKSIMASIQKEDFLASIEPLEAYLCIPICKVHWRFLHFAYNGFHFQYRHLV